ncbi:MAG: TlpA family protein disulfide reductase [Chloroflexi bacterium]|nr:TlpA family protein disulfide reductase [Chloroflexota bacterium]MBU1662632.1 TlpA family protein disulfide reductase [Chloroflexota bacterium]
MTKSHPVPLPSAETQTGPKWGRILAWGSLLVFLTILALGLLRAQEGSVSRGQSVPEFELTTYDDEVFSSTSLVGKVVVLNFWASFCVPCAEEASELETAWQFYKDRGDVIFLGVAWSDMDTRALEYLDRYGITYPNGPDIRTRISQAFRTRGVPETYIIDKNGIISHVQIGPFVSLSQIRAVVDPLLDQ